MKKGFLALAACAMASSAAAATTDMPANDPFVEETATLRLDGLDLSTVDGQQRLAIRMDDAARAVCGDRLTHVHLAVAAKARECQTAVKADIRAQIEARMADNATPTRLASSR